MQGIPSTTHLSNHQVGSNTLQSLEKIGHEETTTTTKLKFFADASSFPSPDVIVKEQQQRTNNTTDEVTKPQTNEDYSHFVDIGINITDKKLHKKWRKFLQRAREHNVGTVLFTGICVDTTQRSLEIAKEWNKIQHEMYSTSDDDYGPTNVYVTVGVHPMHVTETNYEAGGTTIDKLKHLLLENPDLAVAVGECGLDYHQLNKADERTEEDEAEIQRQKQAFREQLRLACELQMPLFLHEREAHSDFVEILDEEFKNKENVPDVVVHCFHGTLEAANAYLDRGYYIGLTGVLCKQGEHWEEFQTNVVPHLPLDRLMVETDAPYLGFRKTGKIRHTEPAQVVDVVSRLAGILGVEEEQVRTKTTETAHNFFHLPARQY